MPYPARGGLDSFWQNTEDIPCRMFGGSHDNLQGLGVGYTQTVSQAHNFPKHFSSTQQSWFSQAYDLQWRSLQKARWWSCTLSASWDGGSIAGAQRRLGLVLSKGVSRRLGLQVSTMVTLYLISSLSTVHTPGLPSYSARKGSIMILNQWCEVREETCPVKISGNLESSFLL